MLNDRILMSKTQETENPSEEFGVKPSKMETVPDEKPTKKSLNIGLKAQVGYFEEESTQYHQEKTGRIRTRRPDGPYGGPVKSSGVNLWPKVKFSYEWSDQHKKTLIEQLHLDAHFEQKGNHIEGITQSFGLGIKTKPLKRFPSLTVTSPGVKLGIQTKSEESRFQATANTQAVLLGVKYQQDLLACEKGYGFKLGAYGELSALASLSVQAGLKPNKTNLLKSHLAVKQKIDIGVQGKLGLSISPCEIPSSPKPEQAIFSSVPAQAPPISSPSSAFFSISKAEPKNKEPLWEDFFSDKQAVYIEVNQDRSRVRVRYQESHSNMLRIQETSVVDFVPEFNAYIERQWQAANKEQRQYLAGLSQEISLLGIPGIQPFSTRTEDKKVYRMQAQRYLEQSEQQLNQGSVQNPFNLFPLNSAKDQTIRQHVKDGLKQREEKLKANQPPIQPLSSELFYDYPAKPAELGFGSHVNFLRPPSPPPIPPSRPAPPPSSSPLMFSGHGATIDFTPTLHSGMPSGGNSGRRGDSWQAGAGVSLVFFKVSFALPMSGCLII